MTQNEIVNRALRLIGEEAVESIDIGHVRGQVLGSYEEMCGWHLQEAYMAAIGQEFIAHSPWIVLVHEEPFGDNRELRFDALRAEGKKLGEINAILEAEGFSEVFGEGVMPCPTKSHEIVRANQGAKQMIKRLEVTT